MTAPSTTEADEPELNPTETAESAETASTTQKPPPGRRTFGLAAATALVMGNIIGGGPAVLAGKGTRDRVRPAGLVRDLIVAALSFAFSFWLIAGAGYAAVYQGVLFLFAGIPVYVWMRGRQQSQELEENEKTAA